MLISREGRRDSTQVRALELGSTALLERISAAARYPKDLVKLPAKAPPSAIFLQKGGFEPFLRKGLRIKAPISEAGIADALRPLGCSLPGLFRG